MAPLVAFAGPLLPEGDPLFAGAAGVLVVEPPLCPTTGSAGFSAVADPLPVFAPN